MRSKYRERLPQLDGALFLTDGGLETTLAFHEGWDLPCFAAFVLLDRYVPMAIAAGEGFLLKSRPRAQSGGRRRPACRDALGQDYPRRHRLMHGEHVGSVTSTVDSPIRQRFGPSGDGSIPARR